MKALITRRSIIIISTAVLIAFISLISVNVFNSSGPVTGAANVITMPIRTLVSTVARTFSTIFASIYRYEELERRYDEALSQIAAIRRDFRESEALSEENRLLRDLLNFRERHGGYAHMQVNLASWNADNFSHSFTINHGYLNSDIQRGMAVATEYGMLIGQVSEVGATESIIITILDTTFSAAAFVGGDNIDNADGTVTAKGDFTQMRNGFLILDHIDDELTILAGAQVFTSGGGAVFPPGFTIGEVVEVRNHSSGIGRYAIVRPTRDIGTIQSMVVILGFADQEDMPQG